MEMRNIIAFQCFIMGREIAARSNAAFTLLGTLNTSYKIISHVERVTCINDH